MYRDRQRNKIRGKEEALELYVVVMYLGIVKILHLLFQKEKFKGLKKKKKQESFIIGIVREFILNTGEEERKIF